MARLLRVEYAGAIYHVTARGNGRGLVFEGDADRTRFLEKLAETTEEYRLRVYAYVLMGNHYHLVVETPRANLSEAMQQFQTSYVVYHNRRHDRSGHLFGGRFKARVVEGNEYLLKLTRYVHLNPVKIHEVKGLPLKEQIAQLRRYRWSSYPAYAGLARREAWVDYGPLNNLIGHGTRAYRRYVEGGLAGTDDELKDAMSLSTKAVGGEVFCAWVEGQYRELVSKQGKAVDAAMRRCEVAVGPEEVIGVVAKNLGMKRDDVVSLRENHVGRDLVIKGLKEFSGLTQREIGHILGHSDGATISKRLKVLRARTGDRAWSGAWKKLEAWHDTIANCKA